MRCDRESSADIRSIDRLERVDRAGRRPCIGELTGKERHRASHGNLGLLVVQRDDRRCGNDVRRRVAGQSRDQGGPTGARIADAPDGGEQAVRELGKRSELIRGFTGGRTGRRRPQLQDTRRRGGEIRTADGAVRPGALRGPGDAQFAGPVLRDLDNDGVDLNLGAANVQPIDHRVHVLHDARRGIDDQRIGAGVGPDADTLRRGSFAGGQTSELRLQVARQVLGTGVVQVTHLGIAGLARRRIQVRNQGTVPQTPVIGPREQNAVGAIVRGDLHWRNALGHGALVQRGEHRDHFAGRGVLKPDHLDFLVRVLIHAADDVQHSVDVDTAVDNDQRVGSRVRCQVPVLRYQGPQDRHELGGADIGELHDLGDDSIAFRFGGETGVHPGRCVGDDPDDIFGFDRDEAMDLQRGQKGLVERFWGHWRIGEKGHLPRHPRVHEKVAASHLAHGLHDLTQVGFPVVRHDLRARLLGVEPECCQQCCQGEQSRQAGSPGAFDLFHDCLPNRGTCPPLLRGVQFAQKGRIDCHDLGRAVADHGNVRHGALAEALEHLKSAAGIGHGRTVDLRHHIARLKPQRRKLLRLLPGVEPEPDHSTLFNVCGDAHDLVDSGRIVTDHTP